MLQITAMNKRDIHCNSHYVIKVRFCNCIKKIIINFDAKVKIKNDRYFLTHEIQINFSYDQLSANNFNKFIICFILQLFMNQNGVYLPIR
jgi:hypothetical protein